MAWRVPDIHAAVADLRARGVRIEEYVAPDPVTVDGIADMGHSWAAWFIDPSRNCIAVVQPKGRTHDRIGCGVRYGARMNGQLLQDAFGHHVWASVAVLDLCAPLTPEQLDTNVPGTYGSIIDTLRHLVGGDAGYLEVLSPGAVEPIDETRRPGSTSCGQRWPRPAPCGSRSSTATWTRIGR